MDASSPPPPEPPLFPISERAALLSRVHVGTTIPLLALCLVPFFARIYVRVWPVWRFGLDDGFIVVGLICAIVDWALLERELFFQPQGITFDETLYAVILAYFAIPLWSIAMTLIKTSVVLTLLRLPLKRTWKIVLYIILAVQASFGLCNTLYNFFKCKPLHAAWDFTVYPRQCPSEQADVVVSHLGSTVNITTDLVLSVAPMFIFWNLRRPLRERVLICSLTGIGLFATFASVMKVVVITDWTGAGDRWATAIAIGTWTITEQFVSIVAACSPSLKKPIERLLYRFGFPLVEGDQTISFVHMPSRLREQELRRQAREWMGEEETHGRGLGLARGAAVKDIESLGAKSVCTSASGSASETTPRGLG